MREILNVFVLLHLYFFFLLTKHSHVWHWYIHCWPLRNLTLSSSWWAHEAWALHWAQQLDSAWSLFAAQSHSTGAQRKRPLEHVQLVHSFKRTQPPSTTSVLLSLCKQPVWRNETNDALQMFFGFFFPYIILTVFNDQRIATGVSTHSIYIPKSCWRYLSGICIRTIRWCSRRRPTDGMYGCLLRIHRCLNKYCVHRYMLVYFNNLYIPTAHIRYERTF